jgi:hypothetical protein
VSAVAAGRRPRRAGASAARRPLVGFALWAVGALVFAGLIVVIDRAWVGRRAASPAPALRVAGAIRSISGSDSVRRATFDPSLQSVRLEVSSRYFDPAKPAAENREYLATEGRLGAQLALFENTSVKGVTILLYSRRDLLATVTANQGDEFGAMRVQYHGVLSGS